MRKLYSRGRMKQKPTWQLILFTALAVALEGYLAYRLLYWWIYTH